MLLLHSGNIVGLEVHVAKKMYYKVHKPAIGFFKVIFNFNQACLVESNNISTFLRTFSRYNNKDNDVVHIYTFKHTFSRALWLTGRVSECRLREPECKVCAAV